jgi:hypothetical protein
VDGGAYREGLLTVGAQETATICALIGWIRSSTGRISSINITHRRVEF